MNTYVYDGCTQTPPRLIPIKSSNDIRRRHGRTSIDECLKDVSFCVCVVKKKTRFTHVTVGSYNAIFNIYYYLNGIKFTTSITSAESIIPDWYNTIIYMNPSV